VTGEQVAPAGQLVHELPVELGQPAEVELLQRLGGAELRTRSRMLNLYSRRATSSPMSIARNSV
jgi:hypothetical protein